MLTEKHGCRLCKGAHLEPFLDLGEQPPANAFLREEAFAAERRFPLTVARCAGCGFVQLRHAVDPDLLFRDYVYVSSTSPSFARHFERYARAMDERLGLSGAVTLDIGSNDGVLVKPLRALGAEAYGVDPAVAIARRATEQGAPTAVGYFTEAFARELADERGKAKLITANNVFAHIDDLDDVARGVKALLRDDGLFVVEAPYLVDLLEQRLFDTVYHEHLSYLSVAPLVPFFARFGLALVDVGHEPVHGGSLRLFVAHAGARAAGAAVAERVARERAAGLHEMATFRRFAGEVEENRRALVELLSSLRRAGKRVAGYGAPAKGNTLLNHFGIGPETLEYIVDDNPLKQGLYTPGMHIPVVSAREIERRRPDYLLLLAWNFARPVMESQRAFAESGGKFIVPVPTPTVIG
ncbi:methyltransferase domain-containing protein [Sorangium sp. So ce341]|uniref:methyltransferase domain-containing protein n=1 Tax=Sorangium sp. So ce341 TaxID=3133302 RepID=UPI003F62E2D8